MTKELLKKFKNAKTDEERKQLIEANKSVLTDEDIKQINGGGSDGAMICQRCGKVIDGPPYNCCTCYD